MTTRFGTVLRFSCLCCGQFRKRTPNAWKIRWYIHWRLWRHQIHNNIASHPDMHASAFDCSSMNISSTKNDLRESENIITSRGEFMSYGPIFKVSSYSSSVVNRQELHNWAIVYLGLVLAELSRCGPHWSWDGVQGKLSALHAKSKYDQNVFNAELVKIL